MKKSPEERISNLEKMIKELDKKIQKLFDERNRYFRLAKKLKRGIK